MPEYVGTYTPEFMAAIAELDSSNASGEESQGAARGIFRRMAFYQSAEELAELAKNADGNGVYSKLQFSGIKQVL